MLFQNFYHEPKGHKQFFFPKSEWAFKCSMIILSAIYSFLKDSPECRVALTGGKSAMKIYQEIAKTIDINSLNNIKYYQTDERFVPPMHHDNNSRLILDTLFKNASLQTKKNFYPIDTNCDNIIDAAEQYNDIFPDELDILILTVGDDGHIASIFPESMLHHTNKKIMPFKSNKIVHSRITISPLTISRAKITFVLAPTLPKKYILFKILDSSIQGNYDLPASLSLNGIWLLSS